MTTNNLGQFDVDTAWSGFGMYCDATVSVKVLPADLVQNVQLGTNYGVLGEGMTMFEGGDAIFTKEADGTYSWEIQVHDPNGVLSFLLDKLIGEASNLVSIGVPRPIILSVVVTDIYGQKHEQDFNIPVPSIEDVVLASSGFTVVQMQCPIDLLITNSQNRSIGAVYQNGLLKETVNQISGAYFIGQYGSNSSKIVILPFSSDSYKITGFAFGAGLFNLTVFTSLNGQILKAVSQTGRVVSNDSLSFYLTEDNSGRLVLGLVPMNGSLNSLEQLLLVTVGVLIIVICCAAALILIRKKRKATAITKTEQIRNVDTAKSNYSRCDTFVNSELGSIVFSGDAKAAAFERYVGQRADNATGL